MTIIDYPAARKELEAAFAQAERFHLDATLPQIENAMFQPADKVFASSTQSYREALLGCVLAKLVNPAIDAHLPYASAGDKAFNGRTLDEEVVNPVLHARRVPCSRGPYLAVFRRSVTFRPETRAGLKDKGGFDALLKLVDCAETTSDLRDLLVYLAYRFVLLREASIVPVSRLKRISLEQCRLLVGGLLDTPSGGRFAVLLVLAGFRSIRRVFGLDWEIDFQGINVSDRASGARGDITIRSGGRLVLAAEVTERAVDRSRVVATFNTKISPGGVEDYLFFVRGEPEAADVIQQVRQYFAQGHDINFLEIAAWLAALLGTLGGKGRTVFLDELVGLLDKDLPQALRVAWNEQVASITSAQTS